MMRLDSAGATMPTKGTVRNLVILCQFADHAHGSSDVPDKAVYEARYNRVGGHPLYAPGGSVRDFFLTNSYGQLTIVSTIVGWVKLPKPSTYYTQKDEKGKLPKWTEFYGEALSLVDPDVDFKQFDNDNDGEVDSIEFIHSGPALYQNCALWLGPRVYASGEGTKVRYVVNLSSAWSMLANICHEMLHQARLPDQYDTDGSSSGSGYHCLMAFGTKGWRVVKPDYAVAPCAWCKVTLGWVKPKVLEKYGEYTARSSAVYPDIFKITKGYEQGEYLLIENRQPLFVYQGTTDAGAANDRHSPRIPAETAGIRGSHGRPTLIGPAGLNKLPKGGLAIWHIDETKKANTEEGYPGQDGWPQNGRHYRIALLQADGCYHLERRKNYGDGLDYFYGGHANAVLGPGPIDGAKTIPSTPTTNTYLNGVVRQTPNQISHVSAPGPEMTFTYENPQEPVER